MRNVCSILLAVAFTLTVDSPAWSDDEQAGAPAQQGTEQAGAFDGGLYRLYFQPRARQFHFAAEKLHVAVVHLCATGTQESLQSARQAWVDSMLTWESVAAIPFGPVLARHSVANIDFWPTRPPMIARATQEVPSSTTILRRTAVAARGLPALEWLLWASPDLVPAVKNPSACAYAAILAEDIEEEAKALKIAFASSEQAVDGKETGALSQLLNQTVGAVEALRRKRLLNPAMVGNPTGYARSWSSNVKLAWHVSWASIQSLLVNHPSSEAPTFEQILRSRDADEEAIRLREAVTDASRAVSAASPQDSESVKHAASALMRVRRILEHEVAMALDIPITFTEFDGD
jgi:predicted lipoprotein